MGVWYVYVAHGGQPPRQLLYLLCFLMGASSAGHIMSYACAKEVNSPAASGIAMGFTNIGGFIGVALVQPLFGYVLDLNWQGAMVAGARVYPLSAYQSSFLLCLAVTFLCIMAGLLIKETRCQNIYSVMKG